MKRLQFGDRALVKNAAISTACKPLSMIVGYFYVPVVLAYLGVEKYGIWSTILSILSWISYFDIGIGNGLRNRLTESINSHKGDERKLASSAYAIITLIMGMLTILFAIVASRLDWLRILGVKSSEEDLASIVIISFTFVAFNFILSLCKNILFAYQNAAAVSEMELAVQILNLVGLLIVKNFISGNLFVIVVIYGVSMIIVNLVTSIILFVRHNEVVPKLSAIDMRTGKSLLNLGMKFFVIQICALVLFTTDSLIISILYGASDVTPYSTTNKLFQMIIGIHAAMMGPIWSAVTKEKALGNFQKINNMTRKLVLLIIPFALGTCLLVFIFRPVMRFWLQQELTFDNGLIIFGALYCILSIWCNTYSFIANGLEIMKQAMIIAVIQAVVNLPLSLLFAEVFQMKSSGVLAGTVGSVAIAALTLPIFVHRTIQKGVKENI